MGSHRLALLAFTALAMACGNATGLQTVDSGSPPDGGAADAGDAGPDAGPDAGDAGIAPDGGDGGPADAGDAGTLDAGPGCRSDSDCDAGAICDAAVYPPACIQSPIQHVVIIVKENHTFDNYFGTFPGAEGTTVAMTKTGQIPLTEAPDIPPHDLCHTHSCALVDWDNGKMDGDEVDGGSDYLHDGLALSQYYERDIPNYWQYARNFALADHFFSLDLGPSFPGHLNTLAAQSAWAIDDPSNLIPWGCDAPNGTTVAQMNPTTGATTQVFPCFDIPSFPTILPATMDWRFYGTDYSVFGFGPGLWTMFDAIKPIHDSPAYQTNIVDESGFDTDVANGALPAITWLVNQNWDDEHPSDCISVCDGENFTVDRVNGLMQSSLWSSTAILITWDDFGGWYDHVPPPVQIGNAQNPWGWGMRIPLIIVSPYVRPGFVYQNNANHASMLRFAERVLGIHQTLNSLDPNAQDAAADDLFGAFDFHQAPLPPLILPDRTDCPSIVTQAVCLAGGGFEG
jgi:phospholipase C